MAKWYASYAKYPYSLVTGLQSAFGVAGGGADAFSEGKVGFEMSGPYVGTQFMPSNPAMAKNFGVVPFPATGIVPSGSTIVQGNFNFIPKGAGDPQAAFEFIAWLAGYDNVNFIATIDPTGGWVPAGPSVAAAAPYKAYVAKYPWLATFVKQMSSPYSEAVELTPNEEAWYNTLDTVTQDLLTSKMTPMQALNYIDSQANG